MATDHYVCTGGMTSCSNMLQRHIAATNHFMCNREFLWKSLSLQQNFIAVTSCTNSVWFDFLQHIATTKDCYRDKDFQKNSPVHSKRPVTMCVQTFMLCSTPKTTNTPFFAKFPLTEKNNFSLINGKQWLEHNKVSLFANWIIQYFVSGPKCFRYLWTIHVKTQHDGMVLQFLQKLQTQ